MSKVLVNETSLFAIADAIREKNGETTTYKPSEMPSGIDAVYITGREDGKQAEREAFWNVYQQNGQRTIYDYAFAGGAAWTDSIFYPKHNMAPKSAANMFTKTGITDLKGRLEELGITLDFSKCPTISNLFNSATTITRLPKMDFSSATNYASVFGWASQLLEIDEIVFNPKATSVANMFAGCTRLTKAIFSGEIKVSGLDLTNCHSLSKDSLTSIINALSTTTSGLKISISMGAVINAFGSLNAAEWIALVGDGTAENKGIRPNWTITVV